MFFPQKELLTLQTEASVINYRRASQDETVLPEGTTSGAANITACLTSLRRANFQTDRIVQMSSSSHEQIPKADEGFALVSTSLHKQKLKCSPSLPLVSRDTSRAAIPLFVWVLFLDFGGMFPVSLNVCAVFLLHASSSWAIVKKTKQQPCHLKHTEKMIFLESGENV